ncbi:hypothetical protein [Enterococcus casseliflavus]|uniref:hypothetical protein n=1 Tax=Enterococcus casseliflavus TaxID=37734 RepID=UPI0028912537|nr:hypothetical protein [Enterococcus casseliflavus]MDT2988004.1 hypothetical protein [Enterococcus casseliflavus]
MVDNQNTFTNSKMTYKELLMLTLLSIYAMLSIFNSSLLPRTFEFFGSIKYILILIQFIFLANIIIELMFSTLKKIFFVSMILGVFLFSYYLTGMNVLLITTIIIISFEKVDFEKIVFFMILGQLLGLLFVLFNTYSGVIENISTIRLGVERFSLGFLNPNTVSNYFFSIALKIMYLFRNKVSFIHLLILNIIFIFIILETNSRTSFVLFIFFDILYLLYVFFTKTNHGKLFLRISIISNRLLILFLLVISYISAAYFSYSNSFWVTINELFSNRISSSYKFFLEYNYSIFGQKVNLVSTYEASQSNIGALILDNGFLQLIIIHGIFATIIFIVYWYKITSMLAWNFEILLSLVLIIYAVYGFTSGLFLSWEYNFVLFYGMKKINKIGIVKNDNRNSYISSIE